MLRTEVPVFSMSAVVRAGLAVQHDRPRHQEKECYNDDTPSGNGGDRPSLLEHDVERLSCVFRDLDGVCLWSIAVGGEDDIVAPGRQEGVVPAEQLVTGVRLSVLEGHTRVRYRGTF